MNDKRHGSGDQYGNRKYFHSDPTWWRARLTMGEARPIRPDDIQRELIKIAHLNPVAIALLTGDVDKLDPNLHCKHVPMTKQGYTLLAASPKLVAFMTTCTDPDQLLSVLRVSYSGVDTSAGACRSPQDKLMCCHRRQQPRSWCRARPSCPLRRPIPSQEG